MSFVMGGVSVYTQLEQGQNAKSAANVNAGQADYQAQVEESNAYKTAQLIRKAGRRAVGQANAGYAASGVVVGEGSAGETEAAIIRGSESDAYQALLEGGSRARALRTDATLMRISGKQAESASYVNAITSALGAFGQYQKASGWRSQGPGYSGTQRAAPVVDRSIRSP